MEILSYRMKRRREGIRTALMPVCSAGPLLYLPAGAWYSCHTMPASATARPWTHQRLFRSATPFPAIETLCHGASPIGWLDAPPEFQRLGPLINAVRREFLSG